jgi:hypothetical protein
MQSQGERRHPLDRRSTNRLRIAVVAKTLLASPVTLPAHASPLRSGTIIGTVDEWAASSRTSTNRSDAETTSTATHGSGLDAGQS